MAQRVLWRCPLCLPPSSVYLPLAALKAHLVLHHGCPSDNPLMCSAKDAA